MTSCCNPRGCDGFFTPRFARRVARRVPEERPQQHGPANGRIPRVTGYRRRNSARDRRRRGRDPYRLLKRGAEHALNLELSPAYADEAQRLLREAGLEERADWRLHDIAASPEVIEPADIVVMHRVVCCYPDYRRLLRADRESTLGVSSSSAIRRAVPSRVSSLARRTSSLGCFGRSSGRSSTRRLRCLRFSKSAGSARLSPTTRPSGR